MKYQLIVFDWDGTLYDSSAYIVICAKRAALKMGYEPPADEVIKQMIGLAGAKAIEKAFPQLSPMEQANLYQTFKNEIRECAERRPTLFEGAKEVLQELNQMGYWLALATGKHRQGLDYDLDELGLCNTFLMTRCADESPSKPSPQMLLCIMDNLGVFPERTLVVGDTEFDIQMAENAEVDAVGVSYGVHPQEHLEKYDNVKTIIHDIRELPAWLNRQPGETL